MTDRFPVRAVVVFLGLVALGGLASMTIIILRASTALDASLLTGIGTITGGAVGSLGTLLARTSSDPDPVVVANTPSDPVPVEPSPNLGPGG